MHIYCLDDIVLKISGEADRFLSGLSSNTLQSPCNAFLNQHGRIIATFFQHQNSENEFLLSISHLVVEDLLKHLDRYAKLSRTQIQKTDLKAYMDIDTAKISFNTSDIPNQVSTDEFTRFRLEKRLPLIGIDYQADEFILNIDQGDFVSFSKGCFLGQEPVAKVHHRSKPTRKLVVKFEDECDQEEKDRMTSKTLDLNCARVRGFIFVKNT